MNKHLDFFEIFPWTSNLETGIESIDEQHKKLVELLNSLTQHLVNHDDVMISEVFDELAAYANYHFDSEESVWEPYFKNDAWYKEHKGSHESFLPSVLEIKEKYSDKTLNEVIEIIVKYLIRWLAHHIIGDDKKMALVIHKVNSGMSFEEAKKATVNDIKGSSKVLIDTVLTMYDRLSSRTLELMKERNERKIAEVKLTEANKRLETLSITDQLTGLYNRRYFEEVFQKELNRAKRSQKFLTFIMLDIDHFKKLNDTYGHIEGDRALVNVADKLQQLCNRSGDYIFRMGGEEFGILITDSNEPVEQRFAEKLCRSIEALKIPNKNSDVSRYTTISMGIASKVPQKSDTEDFFLITADAQLYEAKEMGRNRFQIFCET